jgi:type IV secretion system protein VirB8
MKKQLNTDKLAQELAAVRDLIEGHANMQQLLDLAAEEADRRALEKENSRRLAWRVAGAFGGLALVALAVAGGAVATSMRPAPPPEVLVVDKAGGVVQPLISLAEFQISPEEATIRRNIDTFVTHCEGYSYEQADTHYYTCAAFMSPQLQTQWAQKWDKSNPDSPPNKYKKERRVRVKVGAITVLRNGLGAAIGGRASFTRTEVLNDVEDGTPTNWVANLSFHWVNQPTNERDRRINDLGMEITDYTADRDLGVTKPAPAAGPMRQAAQQQPASPMALVAPGNAQQVTP